jgi:ligand-binding sensor domain-containing protein/two-component sensor histidine kinase
MVMLMPHKLSKALVKSKRRKLVFFAVISIIFFLSSSLQAEQLPIKSYTVADGLAHGTITSIYQDRKGYLWFSTFEGLSLFDGYRFKNYDEHDGLPPGVVNSVTEDREGRLWVATNGGIARLLDQPQENGAKFVAFKIRGRTDRVTTDHVLKLANQVNRMIFDASGNLWCLTDWGLYRANSREEPLNFVTIIEQNSDSSRAALEDLDGHLWFGLANQLFEIRGTETIDHGSVGGTFPENRITGMIRDRSGRLLISDTHKLFEFIPAAATGQVGKWHPILAPALSGTTDEIRILLADETGAIWFGTRRGLIKYADGEQIKYTTTNGLHDDNVQALLKDSDNNLWLGSETRGVCQITSEAIVSYTHRDGLQSPPRAIFEVGTQGLWVVLSDYSVAEIVGGKIVRYDHYEQPILSSQSTMLSYADKIWYGSIPNASLRVKNSRLRLRNGREINGYRLLLDEAQQFYMRFYEDERGALWVLKPDRRIYRANTNTNRGLVFESISCDTDYGIWPGWMTSDGGGGLWLGVVGKIGRVRDGTYSVVTPVAGLPETDPRSFFMDSRGWLWVGLRYQGVSVTREPAAQNPSFVNYSKELGELSSNAVRSITEDNAGRIYFGTDKGLDRFDPNTSQWTHFTANDGLTGSAISSVLKDHNGYIWIVTDGGLSRLDPRRERTSINVTPIYISGIRIAGAIQTLPETGAPTIARRELSATQNNVTVEFVAPYYQGENELLYQYKLEGVSADWSSPTREHSVTFGSLAAGDYRFLVRALTRNGDMSPQPAVFEFRILPPFYLRWWFIVAMLAFIGLAVYSWYRARVSRLLEMERTRTRIATDLHDDIGANLTRIALMSEVANQQAVNDKVQSLLPSIADIARESVASMNDIVWAISPEHDSLVDLTRRMRRHAEEVFAVRDIELDFTAPNADSDLKLSVGVRRDVLLIFKEAVNNAARHSICTKIEIEFRREPSGLYLKITDNGQGFNAAAVNGSGHGLRSMQRRAAALGGKLTIHSGIGTTVEFALPFRRGFESQL